MFIQGQGVVYTLAHYPMHWHVNKLGIWVQSMSVKQNVAKQKTELQSKIVWTAEPTNHVFLPCTVASIIALQDERELRNHQA